MGAVVLIDPVEEFRLAVRSVLEAAEATCGAEALEPHLDHALSVLVHHESNRKEFEEELVSLLDSVREGVVELVSFTMHELRWNAVERELRRRLSCPGGNISYPRLYEAMLDSFSDSWGDRDLYSRFDGNK